MDGFLPLRPSSWKMLRGLRDHDPIVPAPPPKPTEAEAGYVGSQIAPTAIPIKALPGADMDGGPAGRAEEALERASCCGQPDIARRAD
jgi:hypothetical protein